MAYNLKVGSATYVKVEPWVGFEPTIILSMFRLISDTPLSVASTTPFLVMYASITSSTSWLARQLGKLALREGFEPPPQRVRAVRSSAELTERKEELLAICSPSETYVGVVFSVFILRL